MHFVAFLTDRLIGRLFLREHSIHPARTRMGAKHWVRSGQVCWMRPSNFPKTFPWGQRALALAPTFQPKPQTLGFAAGMMNMDPNDHNGSHSPQKRVQNVQAAKDEAERGFSKKIPGLIRVIDFLAENGRVGIVIFLLVTCIMALIADLCYLIIFGESFLPSGTGRTLSLLLRNL